MGFAKEIVDTDFLGRVFKTSVFLSVFIALCLFSYYDSNLKLSGGFMIGSFIGLVFFRVLWWTVDKFFLLDPKVKTAFAVKVTLIKFPLAGLALYVSFIYLQVNVFALIAGLAVVQVVMLLKVIGLLFFRFMFSPVSGR